MFLRTLGARIRQRRLESRLTQSQLARRAGVSVRFLVQLEKGEANISVQRLVEVCAVLDLPLEEVFAGLGPGGPRKVALVGLRGAGKTTIGRRLAERLAVPFVEVDDLVAEEAGMSLGEIFEIRGEDGYREIEARVVGQVLAPAGGAVIATGGSIVTAPDTWRHLRDHARTAWLAASPESHLQRVLAQGDLRPMRGRPHAREELEAILRARAPLYAQAHLTVNTDLRGIEGTVDDLAAW